MKKLYSLLTLIVCLLCSTPGAKAVDYTTIPNSATAISELTSGTYVIKVLSKTVERYLYYDASATSKVFRLAITGISSDNKVTDLSYLWKVTVQSNENEVATLTLQNEAGVSYPYLENGQRQIGSSDLSSTAATFTTQSYTDGSSSFVAADNTLENSALLYYTNSSGTKIYLIGNGGENSPTSLDYWDNVGGGIASTSHTAVLAFYKIEDVDADILVKANTLVTPTSTTTTGYVGDYTQEYINATDKISAAKTALTTYTTSGSSDDYAALKTAVEEVPTFTSTKIGIDESKYYQIKMRKDERAFVSADALRTSDGSTLSTTTIQHPASPTELNKLWKFVASGSGYLIKSVNAGDDYCLQSNGYSLGTTSTVWTLQDGVEFPYQFIVVSGTTKSLNANYSGSSVAMQMWNTSDARSNSDDCSHYYIIPVDKVTLTIGSTGWASVCYPFPVKKPEGLTVYKVSEEHDTYVSLEEYSGDVIPAKTGFFVTGNADDYTMTISSTTPDKVSSGLSGTTVQRTGFAESTYYALAASNGKAVLKTNATSVDVPANKAYLVPTGGNTRELSLNIGETTGISHIATPTTETETYYDLQGRRVLYPVHGIFVKSNGQKVYVK